MAEGEFALVRKHIDLALNEPTDPVRWASAMTDVDHLTTCADLAAQMQDAAGLEKYASAAEVEARRLGHKLYLGIALRAQGVSLRLAGQSDEARRRLDEAIGLFEALRTDFQLGCTWMERAETHADSTAARHDRLQAAEAFDRVGAQPAAERARASAASAN